MTHYKIHYLTDGTKVKITSQLFNQIKQWETEGVHIDSSFLDELKKQDNEWINNTRNYYRNSIAIESLPHQVLNQQKELQIKNFQNISINKIILEDIIKKLSICTKTQRRRFLLHYYYKLSYMEIAELEGRSKYSIRDSVQKAVEMLTNKK